MTDELKIVETFRSFLENEIMDIKKDFSSFKAALDANFSHYQTMSFHTIETLNKEIERLKNEVEELSHALMFKKIDYKKFYEELEKNDEKTERCLEIIDRFASELLQNNEAFINMDALCIRASNALRRNGIYLHSQLEDVLSNFSTIDLKINRKTTEHIKEYLESHKKKLEENKTTQNVEQNYSPEELMKCDFLTDREKIAYRLRKEGKKFREIGEMHGVTANRARVIYKKAEWKIARNK